jgi:hypothetical protein
MPLNYAYQNPVFQPAMRVITAVTNAFPVTITTSFAHQYNSGLIVRINMPPHYGMDMLNQAYAPITVTSPTTFTMPIDTTTYTPFVVPPLNPGHNWTAPQVVPIGSVSSDIYLATQNVLPY